MNVIGLVILLLLHHIVCLAEPTFAVNYKELNLNEFSKNLQACFTIDMAKFVSGKTEQEFKNKLINNGFVVLENAVSNNKIEEMRSLLSKTYTSAEQDEELSDIEKNNIKASHISEEIFKKYNSGRSLFEVFDENLWQLANSFFQGDAHPNIGTHTRRVKPPKLAHLERYLLPIDIHIDAMYHSPREFVLNFWTPLEDCGIDKPTLIAFYSNVNHTFSLMQFDATTMTFDPEVYKSVQNGTAPFLKELPCFYFVVNKGDIVVISNWTLHAGYANESMELPRWSMELRVSANNFWYP